MLIFFNFTCQHVFFVDFDSSTVRYVGKIKYQIRCMLLKYNEFA